MSMGKLKSDAINSGTPLKAFGTQIYFFEDEVDLAHYTEISKRPVCRAAIYGQTLEQLVHQLSIMSQILGSIELLRIAVYEKNDKPVSAEDELALQNVNETVAILRDVIVEKFAPKPR